MARVTPEQLANKWKDRLSGSTQQITDGVNGVTEAPGVKAARQKEVWAAHVVAAKEKWAARVASVPLEVWKKKMIEVGIPRIAQGAAANVDKVHAFAVEFLPYLDRGVAQVRSMPKMSIEDSINRMVAMVRHNASFRRSGV